MRPTHRFSLWNPETGESKEVAVGWQQDAGHVTIKMHLGVALSHWDLTRGGLKLTMFKIDLPLVPPPEEQS